MSSEDNNSNNQHDQKVGKLAVMFPVKLHFILSKDNPAIAWSSDGTAVRVLDKELLVKEYLNLYFDQRTYDSFRHQLTAYGFKKIYKGINVGCYYHPYFLRDVPQYLLQMKRLPSKRKGLPVPGFPVQITSNNSTNSSQN